MLTHTRIGLAVAMVILLRVGHRLRTRLGELPEATRVSAQMTSRATFFGLLQAAGAPAGLLNDAVSTGLIPASDSFDDRALGLLRALVALDGHGIQPRHIRGLRQAAEREVAELMRSPRPRWARALVWRPGSTPP